MSGADCNGDHRHDHQAERRLSIYVLDKDEAVIELTQAAERRIAELVQKAVG